MRFARQGALCRRTVSARRLAAIMNAIADAMPQARALDMPATPLRVWQAIRGTDKENPPPAG